MHTPWDDGVLADGFGRHPVLCVSKADADAFCRSRGGRLPTYFEYFRSVVGAFPRSPRFPWGDEPGEADLWSETVAIDFIDPGEPAFTREVGSFPLGASPEGVLDLVGSASELVEGCPDDLAVATSPVVRPAARPCDAGHLVAGSNWFSIADDGRGSTQAASASSLYIVDGRGAARYPLDHFLFGQANVVGADPRNVSEGRSWRVGFRCAYDLE